MGSQESRTNEELLKIILRRDKREFIDGLLLRRIGSAQQIAAPLLVLLAGQVDR